MTERATVAAVGLVSVLVSLPMLVGGREGDLLVAAALVAVAVGRRAPLLAAAALLIGAAGAARVGSGVLADVSGAHVVLGPALASPRLLVALPAALAAAAGLAAVLWLVPGERPAPGPGASGWLAPEPAGQALAPVAFALLVLAAVAGAPMADPDAGAGWAGLRVGGLVAGLAAAAVFARVMPRVVRRRLPPAAAGLALAALALSWLGA